jgi:hypothetical protein
MLPCAGQFATSSSASSLLFLALKTSLALSENLCMISKLNTGRLESALAQPIIKDTIVEKTTKSSHMFKIPPTILVSILEIMPNPAPQPLLLLLLLLCTKLEAKKFHRLQHTTAAQPP